MISKSSARDDEDQIATIDKAEYHVLIIFSNVRENVKDDISSFISTLGKLPVKTALSKYDETFRWYFS